MTSDGFQTLMRGARRRVLHLYGIVLVAIVLVSAVGLGWSPRSSRDYLDLAVWTTGCLLALGLGLLWIRARVRATVRLAELLEGDTEKLKVTETSLVLIGLSFYFTIFGRFGLPFGWEMDLELESGERLAFGFWTKASCEQLSAIVQDHNAAIAANARDLD